MATFKEPFRGRGDNSDLFSASSPLQIGSSEAYQRLFQKQDVSMVSENIELARNFLIHPKSREDFEFALIYLNNVITAHDGLETRGSPDHAGEARKALFSAAKALGHSVTKLGRGRVGHLESLIEKIRDDRHSQGEFEEIISGGITSIAQAVAFVVVDPRTAINNEKVKEFLLDCLYSGSSALRIASAHFLYRCQHEEEGGDDLRSFFDIHSEQILSTYFSFDEDIIDQFANNVPKDFQRVKSSLEKLLLRYWDEHIDKGVITEIEIERVAKDAAGRLREESRKKDAINLLAASGSPNMEEPITSLFRRSPALFRETVKVHAVAADFLYEEAYALLRRNTFENVEDSAVNRRRANESALQILSSLPENSPAQICKLLERKFENHSFYDTILRTYERSYREFSVEEKSSLEKIALRSALNFIENYSSQLDFGLMNSEERRMFLAFAVLFNADLTQAETDSLKYLMKCGNKKVEILAAAKIGPGDPLARTIILGEARCECVADLIFSEREFFAAPSPARKPLVNFLIGARGKEGIAAIRRQISIHREDEWLNLYGEILAERIKSNTAYKGIGEIVGILSGPPYDPRSAKVEGIVMQVFRGAAHFIAPREEDQTTVRQSKAKIILMVALEALLNVQRSDLSDVEQRRLVRALERVNNETSYVNVRTLSQDLIEKFSR